MSECNSRMNLFRAAVREKPENSKTEHNEVDIHPWARLCSSRERLGPWADTGLTRCVFRRRWTREEAR